MEWNGPPLPKTCRPPACFPIRHGCLLAEYELVIPETLAEETPEIDPHSKLAWIRAKSRHVEPAPLGKQRSRDLKDDIYLACGLAASARYLVTYDGDLLREIKE
jgi:predicted nucleic acid-binding protein